LEKKFLAKVVKTTKSTSANKWVIKHLSRIFFAQDVVFDSDSTHEKVESLLDNANFANHGEYRYERRTLRIIIQECPHPLKTLTNVKDIAQAALDVACSTRLHSFLGSYTLTPVQFTGGPTCMLGFSRATSA
jgi:hypothetical protein